MCTGSSAESWAEKRKGPGGYPALLPLFRGWNRVGDDLTRPCSICVWPPLTPSIACAESAMASSTLRSGRYPFAIVSRASSAAWPIANAEPLNVVPLGSTWMSCTPSASTPAITTDAPNGRTAYIVNSCRYSERLRSEEHTSELQSRQYLVCRLLLEKKKHTIRVVMRADT